MRKKTEKQQLSVPHPTCLANAFYFTFLEPQSHSTSTPFSTLLCFFLKQLSSLTQHPPLFEVGDTTKSSWGNIQQ